LSSARKKTARFLLAAACDSYVPYVRCVGWKPRFKPFTQSRWVLFKYSPLPLNIHRDRARCHVRHKQSSSRPHCVHSLVSCSARGRHSRDLTNYCTTSTGHVGVYACDQLATQLVY